MARTKKAFKWAHILTGGASGALDAINGNNLIDLDAHIVMTQTGGFLYSLDDDAGGSESSPSTIAPDVNAGTKMHLLQGLTFPNTGLKILETSGANTLTLKWNETDSADRVLSLLVGGGNRSLTLNENLTIVDGHNIELHGSGGEKAQLAIDTQNAERTLDLSQSLTIGSGNDGTITFKQASKALNVEGSNLTPYTGWPVTPGVTISFSNPTLTVTDDDSAFYYCEGVKYILGENKTVDIDGTEGLWYFYFDGATLTASQTIWSFGAEDKALVAILYWDATNEKILDSPMYELHNYTMDGSTHSRLHYGGGAAWEEGLLVSEAASEQIDVTAGKLRDEDIRVTITDGNGGALWEQVLSPAELPIYYRDGAAAWRIFDVTDKPADHETDVGYVDGSNDLKYNKLDGTWGLTTVAAPNHVAYWVVATNNQTSPISLIMGQRIDTILANAKANNVFSGLDLIGLPFQEMIVLARVIIKDTGSSPYYSIEEIVDLRVTNITGNITTPLTGDYILRSLFDADTFLYATADNTPIPTSPANVMAALSGHAGAAFDFNSQALTSVGAIGCGAITSTGTSQMAVLGVGLARTEGTLHVHTATAGTVAANTSADDLVVENNDHGGISILVPDNKNAQIYLGTASLHNGGICNWNYDAETNGILNFGTNKANAQLVFRTGAYVEAMRINGAGELTVSDHGTAATDMVVNVAYGTGAAPTANTTTIGALYITYVA